MREARGVREACVLAHSVPRLPSSPREEGEEEGERLSRRGVGGEWRGGAAGGGADATTPLPGGWHRRTPRPTAPHPSRLPGVTQGSEV